MKPKFHPKLQLILAYGILISIVVVTLVSLLSSRIGWIYELELLSHFQLQYWLLAIILVSLLNLFRYPRIFYLGLLCMALIAAQVLVWYLPSPNIASSNNSHLRLLVSNVKGNNQNYEPILNLTRKQDPDVAIFIETNRNWVEQLDSLRDLFPYAFGNPELGVGITIYSKQPLDNAQVKQFELKTNASIVTNLNINNQNVTLIASHPPAPQSEALFHQRNFQLNQIAQYIANLSNPVIVAGDLNITMWSPYYNRFKRISGLHNARKGFGLRPTWSIRPVYNYIPQPLFPIFAIPIDHFLVSRQIKVANIYIGEDIHSDHLPIIMDISLQ